MRSVGLDTDKQILSGYASGQVREAYALLAQHYRSPLVRLFEYRLGSTGQVRGKLADDLTQDTLERIHARLCSGPVDSLPGMIFLQASSIFQRATRPSRDALDRRVAARDSPFPETADQAGDSALHRVVSTSTSAKEHAPAEPELEIDLELVNHPQPETMQRARHLRVSVLDCIRAIPNPRHRQAFQHWLLGETYQEIASHLGWKGLEGAATAVKSAKRLFLECLRSKGEDIPDEL